MKKDGQSRFEEKANMMQLRKLQKKRRNIPKSSHNRATAKAKEFKGFEAIFSEFRRTDTKI